jgi:voltage-gated potassium channel
MRWKRGEREPETIVPFEDLTPRERRAKIAKAILTASVVSTLIVLVYFGFPLTRTSPERSVILFVVSLVLVGIVWVAQILATLQSPYPSLRAMESLGTSVPLYLITFATTHYLIEYRHTGSYSQPMTRLDALYFATTVFTTVGFGDITPISERARVVTLLQMVGNLILIGLVARILLSAGQLRRSLAERTNYRPQPRPPDTYDRGT